MSGWTTHGAQSILGGVPLPATLYVRFHTGDPGAAGTANYGANEAREPATFEADPDDVTTIISDIDVTHTGLVATETVTHITLWDDDTDGDPWAVVDLSPTLDLTAAGSNTFAAGTIRLTQTTHGG